MENSLVAGKTFDLKVKIDCRKCERKLKRLLKNIQGIHSVGINGKQGIVTIKGTVDPLIVILMIEKDGRIAELLGEKFPVKNGEDEEIFAESKGVDQKLVQIQQLSQRSSINGENEGKFAESENLKMVEQIQQLQLLPAANVENEGKIAESEDPKMEEQIQQLKQLPAINGENERKIAESEDPKMAEKIQQLPQLPAKNCEYEESEGVDELDDSKMVEQIQQLSGMKNLKTIQVTYSKAGKKYSKTIKIKFYEDDNTNSIPQPTAIGIPGVASAESCGGHGLRNLHCHHHHGCSPVHSSGHVCSLHNYSPNWPPPTYRCPSHVGLPLSGASGGGSAPPPLPCNCGPPAPPSLPSNYGPPAPPAAPPMLNSYSSVFGDDNATRCAIM